ncbi:MAG: GNAT family N-acetyltransferase [Acidimicrobiales bacterium]
MEDEVTPPEPESNPQELLNLDDEAALASGAPEVTREGDEVVIDLRELAPTGRKIAPGHRRSGRPPDLLPQHRMEVISGGERWSEAERFVYEVYVELGYTAASSRQQVEELAEYIDCSRFHAVVDDDNQILGTTRAIFGTFEELPVGKFTRVNFEDEGPMCELSSIVVDPRVRSRGIIEHLYREGWADATRGGARAITGVGERWLLDAFRDTYAMPFIPVGVPKWYMGGQVIPMIMANGLETHTEVASNNPGYWYWNIETLSEAEVDRFGFRDLVTNRPAAVQK